MRRSPERDRNKGVFRCILAAGLVLMISCAGGSPPGICFSDVVAHAAETGDGRADKTTENEETKNGMWSDAHEVGCRDRSAACCLLQMVMMGEFASFDPGDILYLRIYTAVFTQLREIKEPDFAHLEEEFGCEKEDVENLYRQALSNCLYADILFREQSGEALSDADLIWLLFLDASFSEPGEEELRQIEMIRSEMTDEVITRLAEAEGVDETFTRKVICEK